MILSTLYFPFLVPVSSITMLPLSSSSRCPVLIPEICDYLTHKQEGLCSYDKTNTKNSSWEAELIMDYLGGQFNHQGLYKEEDFRMSCVSGKMWPDRNVTTAVHVRVLWLLEWVMTQGIQKAIRNSKAGNQILLWSPRKNTALPIFRCLPSETYCKILTSRMERE